jgi:hypothetical protein
VVASAVSRIGAPGGVELDLGRGGHAPERLLVERVEWRVALEELGDVVHGRAADDQIYQP